MKDFGKEGLSFIFNRESTPAPSKVRYGCICHLQIPGQGDCDILM